jgi:predicted nucleic acid-binding protein
MPPWKGRMAIERLLLDTNTIVRFLTGDPPKQAEKARALIAKADCGEVELMLIPVALAETFFTLESFYEVERPEVARLLIAFISSRGIHMTEKELSLAALLRCQQSKAHFVDAFLAAVALETGHRVASFDRDFDRFAGVIRIEPGSS